MCSRPVGLGAVEDDRQQGAILHPLEVAGAHLRLLLPAQNVIDVVDRPRMLQALAQEVLLQPRRGIGPGDVRPLLARSPRHALDLEAILDILAHAPPEKNRVGLEDHTPVASGAVDRPSPDQDVP